MAETTEVIVKFKVEDGNIDQFKSKITSLNGEITKVEKGAKSTASSVKKEFSNAEGAANNLKGGVGGIAQQFGVVAKAAKAGGAAMKSALISTGIGILVVALGEIVANWDAISNFITGANEEIAKQKKLNEDIIEQLEREKFLREANKDLIANQVEEETLRAKIAGASESEIYKIKEKGVIDRLTLAKEEAAMADSILRASVGADEETYRKAEENQIAAFKKLGEARSALLVTQLQEELRIKNAARKGKVKGRDKEKSLDGVDAFDSQNLSGDDEQQALLDKEAEQFSELFDLKKQQQDALTESATNGLLDIANNEGIINAERLIAQQEYADASARIARIEAEQKRDALDLYANAAQATSELVGRETGVGKGLAVASTLISTYLSAQKAYESQFAPLALVDSPIRGAIAAGVAVASGLANVKAILSVKTPSGGGSVGGGGAVSAPAAPSFNVVGNNPVNQIAESLNAQQNPIQAYVVSGSVTSQQELDRNIQNVATIG